MRSRSASRTRTWLGVSALAALVLAACGGGSGSDGSAGGGTDKPAASATASDGDTAESPSTDTAEGDPATAGGDDGDVQKGGTLVLASTQVPRTLNGLVQSGYATAVPGTQLSAGLVRYEDSFDPMPYLADSWEVSDDGLQVTFKLHEGATFHDGTPVTSEDVAFSIETARDNHPFKPMFAPVESVDTPDDLTAVVNLSQPHPALLIAVSPALCPILPKHIYGDGQDIATHPRNTADFVGSGPFQLTEYKPESLIRMKKFADFNLADGPYLDEIVIQILPDPNAIALGMENGSMHLTVLQGAANTVRWQKGDNPVVSDKGAELVGQINWLEFNLSDPDLAKPEVRKAIAYAINKDDYLSNVDLGLSARATTGIAPDTPFYNPDAEAFDQDIDKAKQLLADAGYADGDISIQIDYLPPAQQAGAEFIVQQLKAIGINAEVRASPDFPTWAERIASGDFQATLNNVWNWGDPVIGVARTYLSTNRVGVIWTNNTGYENTEVDDLLNKAAVELDTAKRTDLYNQFQVKVNEDVPIVFLTSPKFWQASSPKLHNPPEGVWGQMSPMLDVWLEQ